MNITKENISELELLLKVEISESDYKEKVSKQLKEYQKKAVVPGFRKGMAPLPLIKKMYQKAIVADEVQGILSESLYKYIEDEKLEIVGSPLSNDEKTGEIDFDGTDFVRKAQKECRFLLGRAEKEPLHRVAYLHRGNLYFVWS